MDHFQPHMLRTDDGFATALRIFEDHLISRNPRFGRMLEAVVKQDAILEKLVSRMSHQCYNTFREYLEHQCSDDSPADFLQSTPSHILFRFESILDKHVPVPFEDFKRQIPRLSHSATTKSAALSALVPYCALESLEPITDLPSLVFDECGVRVPKNGKEAQKLAGRLVRELLTVMKAYMNIIRDGRLAEAVLKYYNSCCAAEDEHDKAAPTEVLDDLTLPELTISRKRAVTTIDQIDAFGHVKVNVSTRFVDNMRTSRKRPRLFEKIKDTVAQLARGSMHGQNAMVLAESEGSAVYSAYLNKHCSIVYHCPRENEIRVFGVYASETLRDNTFWDATAKELATRTTDGSDGSRSHSPTIKEPELADRVRFLIVLDRFVELSKSMVQRIQDDKEVQAMFQLSQQEEEVVEHDGACYVLGRSGTGKTTIMLFKMINMEAAWSQYGGDVALKPRQLFVTRSQNLADRVRESFMRLHETHVAKPQHTDSTSFALFSHEDQVVVPWNHSIPDSFSELTAEHFPLFVSFDKLCVLLETSLGISTCSSSIKQSLSGSNCILLTYEIFLKQYWDACPDVMKFDFGWYILQDPFLVYGEIIGVIKGSEETLASGQRFLDKSAYIGLGRWYSAFENCRDELYMLFIWYRRRQAQLRHLDIADRTHAILEAFREDKPSFLRSLDFVYIDEAQDNLLIDIQMLRLLCKNADGLLYAGDTAQTIFAGNSFTFNTLKAFLHREEGKDLSVYRARHPAAFFKLTVNFRSRAGIVACGQTLLEIIGTFWPTAIDQIPRELNLSCGTRPYFFIGDTDGRTMLDRLLSETNQRLEFGAEQCILVRDEAIRDSLRGRLGDSTLLLTLYESKGLEFNDVLLWNFFADSSYNRSDWVAISENGTGRRARDPSPGLAIELKFLYVATTRAKNRLWILDDSDQAKVMQEIWTCRGEVETGVGSLDLAQFAAASGQEEWAQKGHVFFREARYKLAAQAWRSAGLHHDAAVASAFHLRDQVDVTSTTAAFRSKALREAAEAFRLVAAEEPIQERKDQYYAEGAVCFLRIPDTEKAAFAYKQGHDYTRAVLLFRKIAMFEEALSIIRQHDVELGTATQVSYIARLYYFQQLRLVDALELHTCRQEALDFLDEHGLRSTKSKTVLHLGLNLHAAELHLRANRPTECLKYIKMAKAAGETSLFLDMNVLLDCLWRDPALSVTATSAPTASTHRSDRTASLWTLVDLCGGAKDISQNYPQIHREVTMFRAISTREKAPLAQCLQETVASQAPNRGAALLCLRHLRRLSALPSSESAFASISGWLDLNIQYVAMLRSILDDPGYLHHRDMQRLAGFRPVSSQEVHLLPEGLALMLVSRARRGLLPPNGPQIVKNTDLFPLVTDYVRSLLLDAVDEITAAHSATLTSTSIGGATGSTNPSRLQYVLQLILLEDSARGHEPIERHMARKSSSLGMLYRLVVRGDSSSGSTVARIIQEMRQGSVYVQVLMAWIRDMLGYIPRIQSEKRSTVLIQLALLSALLDPGNFASHVVRLRSVGLNAPNAWLLVYPPHQPLRHQTAQFVLNDLLDASEGVEGSCLHSGVQFLGHLVQSGFTTDVYTLCDFIDYLLGGYIVALCGGIDDTPIPLVGASLVLQNVRSLAVQETDSLSTLLETLGEIMWRVLVPRRNELLLSADKSLQREERYKVIIRICEGLGILGYAAHDGRLRQDVVAVMKRMSSIRGVRIDYPPVLRFIQAKNWSSIEGMVSSTRVARLTIADSDHVGLKYTLTFGPLSRRSKRKVADDIDVGSLFQGKTPLAFEFSVLCAIDGPFIFSEPRATKILCGRLAEAMASTMPGRDELRAFQRIQSFVRRQLVRRRKTPGTGLSHVVSEYFAACLRRVQELRLCSSPGERRMYLGSLPHALACLDGLRMYFEAEKERLSKKLQAAPHIDLDDAGARVKKEHARLSKTLELHKILQPESDYFDQPEWLASFRSHIEDIGELMDQAKPDHLVRQDLMAEWGIVHKAVLYTGRTTWIR